MSHAKTLTELRDIAEEAGFTSARVDPETQTLKVVKRMPQERHQHVYVKPKDESHGDHKLVTFYAYCRGIKAEDQDELLKLLQENWALPIGKYAVTKNASGLMLAICCDHLLEFMQKEEFATAVDYVAGHADDHERRLNKDQY